jgi:DNA-binding beta-propeller fold protein YncE
MGLPDYDSDSGRLFVAHGSGIDVVDGASGKLLGKIAVPGANGNAAGYDAVRKRVFSSNFDGTLSVIRQDTPQHYIELGNVPTHDLARTMALNPQTGRVYLVAADRIEVDSSATDPRKHYAVRPGSVALLFADPSD